VHQLYGVSPGRQVAEVLYYYWRHGAGHADYYMFELYRRDFDEAARQRFLVQAAWEALSQVLNQPNRRSDDSKLALAVQFAERNMPIPRTLGYTAATSAPSRRDGLEFIPLVDLVARIPPTGCVLKPDHSSWGRGIFVFKSCQEGRLERVDGTWFDVETLLASLSEQGGTFLVQERLENHPHLAALGLPSLATLRVVTYGTRDNIRVARASLKLPVGRHGVDNYHAGGIAAPVNLESGVVGQAVGEKGMEWLSSHPESGRRFEGMTVPLWNEVLAETRRAAMSMPEFRCLGWDVAVTLDGIRILEANSVWSTPLVQRPHRAGMWEGDFRQWCLDTVRDAELPRPVRRWLGC
jgi:hypothetical protein